MWILAGVLVVVPVEERSAVSKSMWARFASGYLGSAVWCFPILRGPLRYRGRGTTARRLRAMPGLWGLIGAVAGVGPDCDAPGSAGGRHPQLAVSVGVGVRDRCSLRAPLTLGVLSVSRGGPPWVLTSGVGTDARGACE